MVDPEPDPPAEPATTASGDAVSGHAASGGAGSPTAARRGGVPAARQTLAVLQALARAPSPVPAATLARVLGLPRSTTYHLLAELVGAGFVIHLPEERRYGLGVNAYELGTAYLRQEPLARLATPVLRRLVDAGGHTAHLAVLRGREVVYLVEERAPGRPRLVTDVEVRLPAELTASGRAILAGLPAAHVRALYPGSSAFVQRHELGPTSLHALRSILAGVRRRGWASEDGQVTPGFASVAVAATDHAGTPVAAIAVTHPVGAPDEPGDGGRGDGYLAALVARSAAELTRRLGGGDRR